MTTDMPKSETNHDLTEEQEAQLESLVLETNLWDVLSALVDICFKQEVEDLATVSRFWLNRGCVINEAIAKICR